MNVAWLPLRRRKSRYRATNALTPSQFRWVGALLLATMLPQAPYLPPWVAGLGLMLVGVRFGLLRHDRLRPGAAPARISGWSLVVFALAAAVALRLASGTFASRENLIAFIFILVGIKFLEARNVRDGMTLVCLACLLTVAPFFHDPSPIAAFAAIPAVVLIGATLHAISRPRDLAGTDSAHALSARATLRLSARMLLQGIPLAALVFVLFPRLASPLWILPADGAASTGLTDRMSPGHIRELSRSDAVAFRVDFDGVVPPPERRYWRGPVLTRFDGVEWSVLAERAPAIPVRISEPTVDYTVTMEPNGKRWLFALDVALGMPSAARDEFRDTPQLVGTLTRDHQLLSRSVVWQTLRFRERSVLRDRYPHIDDAVGERLRQESLALPRDGANINPRTTEFALALRASNPDPLDFAGAVLAHFRNEPFVYTLVPGKTYATNAVDGFLFDSRRGFCEHYASAFVVLMRAAGIPSRVVTGFQGGEINPRGGYLIVREYDAHAWAEALIDGQWRRFDPTAAVAPSRIEIGLGSAIAEEEAIPLLARLDSRWLRQTQLAWDAFNYGWRQHVAGFGFDRQRELWRSWKLDLVPPGGLLALAFAAAAMWAGAILGWLIWRRRRSDRAGALWNRACTRLSRAGLARLPNEGPLSYAARASARWPEFAVALSVLADAYAALRYGPAAVEPDSDPRRAGAIARMERALGILPAAARLRSIPA